MSTMNSSSPHTDSLGQDLVTDYNFVLHCVHSGKNRVSRDPFRDYRWDHQVLWRLWWAVQDSNL